MGDDTVIVTVSEIPAIEVFAGRRKNVNQNEAVEFSGSFTRPIRPVERSLPLGLRRR